MSNSQCLIPKKFISWLLDFLLMWKHFQQIQAQTVIIIHPGSQNLRMGRASDLNPCTILNAIARRRKVGGTEYHDSSLPSLAPRVRQNLVSSFSLHSLYICGANTVFFLPDQRIDSSDGRIAASSLAHAPIVFAIRRSQTIRYSASTNRRVQ